MLLLAGCDQFLGGQHVVVADGLAELAHDLVGHGWVLCGWAMRVSQPRQAGGHHLHGPSFVLLKLAVNWPVRTR
jgi:hypothetical protein